tara:strand:- start:883 stop:1275 length:393 start_codon:yes stop_codon:yes gene_type:complete
MDYISALQDSIDTSVDMKLFKNRTDSSLAHIFKSKLVKFSLSKFKNVDNFDVVRLKKSAVKAYPLNNRPRGNKDISSVKFYQKQIQKKKDIQPIWMILKDKKYILLDGAHRIVASYIENKNNILAYIIII